MHLDIINDIHLDFYTKFNTLKIQAFIEKLINTKTDKTFDVLVIAGDIGHYNDDNVYFLKEITKHYKKVFVTWGNHDLYLFSSGRKKYNYNSFNRLKDLKDKVSQIPNLTFWGSGLWYDVASINHWANYMNDARYIYDRKEPYKIVMPYEWYPTKFNFNTNKLYEKEYEKIKNLDRADIIISHIPPVNFGVSGDMGDNYYFVPYGEEIIEKIKPKMWIFGHTHIKRDLKFGKTRLICNPLGYPNENKEFKLKSVKI